MFSWGIILIFASFSFFFVPYPFQVRPLFFLPASGALDLSPAWVLTAWVHTSCTSCFYLLWCHPLSHLREQLWEWWRGAFLLILQIRITGDMEKCLGQGRESGTQAFYCSGCEDWWSLLPSAVLLTMPLLAMVYSTAEGIFWWTASTPPSLLVQFLVSDDKLMIQLDTKQSGSWGSSGWESKLFLDLVYFVA